MLDKITRSNPSFADSTLNQEKPPIDNSAALRMIEAQIFQATDKRKSELKEIKEIILRFRTGDKVKLKFHKMDKPALEITGEVAGYKASLYKHGWRLAIKVKNSNDPEAKEGEVFKLRIDHLGFSESDHYSIITNLDFNKLEFIRNCTGDQNIKTNNPNWQERIGNGMYKLYELEKIN